MNRYFAFCLAASFPLLTGCALSGSTPDSGVSPVSSAQIPLKKKAEELVVPFEGSYALATFDTSGNLKVSISGSKTHIEGPLGAASDAAGNLYVVSSGPKMGVYEFAKGASGNVAPTASDDGVTASGIASDGTHVYVSNSYTGEISEYDANPLGSSPIATLSGKKSKLCAAVGLALDKAQDVYVTQQGFGSTCKNELLEFAPLAPGQQDVAPIRTIAGAKTKLQEPQGVAVDASGNVFVADIDASLVFEFGKTQSGNVKPEGTFGTTDYPYYGVAVDSSNDLFASAPSATDVSGQIDVFDSTKPSAEPQKTLKIGKKPGRTTPSLISL